MRPPFNVTVSSVKGPDFPLFCAGSRVAAMYPVGPIAEGIGLNVTILSYLDQLHFGLLACRKLLPEWTSWPSASTTRWGNWWRTRWTPRGRRPDPITLLRRAGTPVAVTGARRRTSWMTSAAPSRYAPELGADPELAPEPDGGVAPPDGAPP